MRIKAKPLSSLQQHSELSPVHARMKEGSTAVMPVVRPDEGIQAAHSGKAGAWCG
ncbi:hypothetical protein G9U52_26395 [Paenibacillus sp. S3N08]|uniref:Uncharacterized protein n=1 Tax=Paenibacillus agricola TaxID=2716264 RepID=A0ABX0JDK8_9BACL|nr:hypothetical protein [Paenibacillus agricola]